jgi:hypothetical protein
MKEIWVVGACGKDSRKCLKILDSKTERANIIVGVKTILK